ncbi:helix-turn-helix domain-containing protein [Nocardia higoensis]|uniref:helix-turn-helix domain-containing protein n=1 Tax=Nocardia higoensis TaxID=228599 RepID=UPI002B4AF992|nr:helix-turn-helix domain-containing protein [Nocardia higoensis]
MSDESSTRPLAHLRRQRGLSQGDLERRAGMSQAAVLSAERAKDPRLSTVSRFVEALGGRLQLVASFDDADYPLTFPQPSTATLPVTEGQRPAWRIRAWNETSLAKEFLKNGLVAMSEDEIGRPVTEIGSEQELRDALRAHPNGQDRPEKAFGAFVTYWNYFSQDMQVGDTIVLAYLDRAKVPRAAIGVITGEYEYRADDSDARLRHRRAVRWTSRDLARRALDDDLRRTVSAPGTICQFGAADAGTRLAALAAQYG